MNVFGFGGVLVQAIGWSLVHFLWQAIVVGVVYACARWLLPRGNARYIAAMLALLALAIMPAWTLVHEFSMSSGAADVGVVVVDGSTGPAASTSAMPATAVAQPFWQLVLRHALPWLVLAWGCGVTLLAARVGRQWHNLRLIVRMAEALPAWQARARVLGCRLGTGRAVRVLASVRIVTPTLVGWVRPSIVMPMAMLARMPAEQIDLVLAHELAHLRRFDHLANLFQVVLETLLFYHPVVHWISRDARNERELCCDALALQATGGKRRDFVAALAGLEEFRSGHAEVALAASGGVLVERAWFIAGGIPRQRPHLHLGATVLGLCSIVVTLGVLWQYHVDRQVEFATPAPLNVLIGRHATAMTYVVPTGAAPSLNPVAPAQVDETADESGTLPVPAPVVLPRPRVRVNDLGGIGFAIHAVVQAGKPLAAVPLAAPLPVVAAPEPVRVVAPVYPASALERNVHGRVVISFTLDGRGRPRDLAVVSASPTGVFELAALQAIGQWRFRPAAVTGRRFQQAFSFTPGTVRGADVIEAKAGCYRSTGTHICRQPDDAGNGVQTLASPKP